MRLKILLFALTVLFMTGLSAQRLGIPHGHRSAITSLNFLSTGELVSTSADGRLAHYWDVGEQKWIRSKANKYRLRYLSVTAGDIAICQMNNPLANPNYRKIKDVCKDSSLIASSKTPHLKNIAKLASGLSADGRYVLDGNRLIPGNTELGDTIILDFTPTGFTNDGNSLYRLTDGVLEKWEYPYLSPQASVKLEQAHNETLTFVGKGYIWKTGYAYAKIVETSATTGPTYRIWNVNDGSILTTFEAPLNTTLTDISENGKYLLLLTTDPDNYDSTRRRFKVATGEIDLAFDPPVTEADSYQDALGRSIFSPDGSMVVSPSKTGAIYLFDTETGQQRGQLYPQVSVIDDLVLAEDDDAVIFQKRIGEETIYQKWDWSATNRIVATTEREFQLRLSPTKSLQSDNGERLSISGTRRSLGQANLSFKIYRKVAGQIIDSIAVDHRPIGSWRDQSFYSWDSNDEGMIAIGSNGGEVLFFKADGSYQNTLKAHTEAVTAVRFFYHSQRMITSSLDGTIKVWDMSSRELLATLVLLNDADWVVLGPNNVFDASNGAMSLLYFLVGENSYQQEYIELGQMKERYYDPGLLQKLLGYSEVPVRSTEGLTNVNLYPKVELSLIQDTLHVVATKRWGGFGQIALYINGKEVEADIDRWLHRSFAPNSFSVSNLRRYSVPLKFSDDYRKYLLRDNEISIRAFNEEGSLHSSGRSVKYHFSDGIQINARGNANKAEKKAFTESVAESASLHVVCVGTSNYRGDAIDLTFPDQDAIAMSNALRAVGNELFGTKGINSKYYCLTSHATSDSARAKLHPDVNWRYAQKAAIEETLLEIREKAAAQDVVVVYFSGHGKTVNVDSKEQFHYLTSEASSTSLTDPDLLRNIAVSSAELTELLNKIPAYKQVVILDACESGQVISELTGTKQLNGSQIRALGRMSDRSGLYLIAGSAANSVSFEASNYGQGLLTYALLEGMNGNALQVDKENATNFFVGVTELFEYAQLRVPKLAENLNGIQEPQITYPNLAGSFPLGIFNDRTVIPLSGVKPILTMTNFQSDTDFSDHLRLEEKVEQLLRRENAFGKDARFIFVDVADLPNAYQLRGRYKLKGDQKVDVTAYLVRSGKPSIRLDIPAVNKEEIAIEVVVAINEAIENLRREE